MNHHVEKFKEWVKESGLMLIINLNNYHTDNDVYHKGNDIVVILNLTKDLKDYIYSMKFTFPIQEKLNIDFEELIIEMINKLEGKELENTGIVVPHFIDAEEVTDMTDTAKKFLEAADKGLELISQWEKNKEEIDEVFNELIALIKMKVPGIYIAHVKENIGHNSVYGKIMHGANVLLDYRHDQRGYKLTVQPDSDYPRWCFCRKDLEERIVELLSCGYFTELIMEGKLNTKRRNHDNNCV